MRRSAWLLALALGCDHGSTPEPASPAARAVPREPSAAVTTSARIKTAAPTDLVEPTKRREPLRFAGAPEHTQDFILGKLKHARVRAFKPLGARSSVFKLELFSPIDAAFKIADADRPHGPASEVAAYRLSRCLGLQLVPPAVSRDFQTREIREGLPDAHASRWPELQARLGVGNTGVLHGAAIYWVSELVNVGLDGRAGLQHARQWLDARGDPPIEQRSLAAALSTLLVFDYLIGNFDRFSGDNVAGDSGKSLIYLRDHDLAFPATLGERLTARMLAELRLAQRFSRTLYSALRALTRAELEAELALDPGSKRRPLLSEGQLAAVFERRDHIIAHIAAMVAQHGAERVLCFP